MGDGGSPVRELMRVGPTPSFTIEDVRRGVVRRRRRQRTAAAITATALFVLLAGWLALGMGDAPDRHPADGEPAGTLVEEREAFLRQAERACQQAYPSRALGGARFLPEGLATMREVQDRLDRSLETYGSLDVPEADRIGFRRVVREFERARTLADQAVELGERGRERLYVRTVLQYHEQFNLARATGLAFGFRRC